MSTILRDSLRREIQYGDIVFERVGWGLNHGQSYDIYSVYQVDEKIHGSQGKKYSSLVHPYHFHWAYPTKGISIAQGDLPPRFWKRFTQGRATINHPHKPPTIESLLVAYFQDTRVPRDPPQQENTE